jgi:hypothetical protein
MFLRLLQEAPAETTGYMIAGYVVIFGVMLVYLASLMLRNRSLKQDLEVLEDFRQQQKDE